MFSCRSPGRAAGLAGVVWFGCTLVATLLVTPAEAITPTSTPVATPTFFGGLGTRTLGGVVFDLSSGRRAIIPNAEVVYRQRSTILEGASGATFTTDDGRYQFDVQLRDTDLITVSVSAPGFSSAGLSVGGLYAHSYPSLLDIGLEPVARSEVPPACAGDCGRNDSVTVVDLIKVINVALGAPVEICDPGDVDRDGIITVDEVTLAASRALEGCDLTPPDFSIAEVYATRPQDCSSGATMFVCLRNDGGATDRIVEVDVQISAGLSEFAESFELLGLGAGEVRCHQRVYRSSGMVTIDPVQQIAETDETNNSLELAPLGLHCLPTPSASPPPTPTASARPTTTRSFVSPSPTPTRPTATPTLRPAPNLIVSSVAVDPFVSYSACIFDVPSYPRLGLCIRNVGNVTAGPFSISLRGADVLRVDELRVGNFFCRSVAFVAEGTVVVDSRNEIDESNEEDNTAEFSLVPKTPPATCTPVKTPTPTATELYFSCCQDTSVCHQPPFNGICFTGTGYESPAFCNTETGQCENIPPTRTPTPTRNPTQPPADLVPVSADLYAPLLGCGRNNPIGGRYCVTNLGGDVSASFVLRLVTDSAGLDFASFAGIRGAEVLCVVGPHERFAQFLVDPYDAIAESDESNNSLSFSLPIPTYPPDCTSTPTPRATETP